MLKKKKSYFIFSQTLSTALQPQQAVFRFLTSHPFLKAELVPTALPPVHCRLVWTAQSRCVPGSLTSPGQVGKERVQAIPAARESSGCFKRLSSLCTCKVSGVFNVDVRTFLKYGVPERCMLENLGNPPMRMTEVRNVVGAKEARRRELKYVACNKAGLKARKLSTEAGAAGARLEPARPAPAPEQQV